MAQSVVQPVVYLVFHDQLRMEQPTGTRHGTTHEMV